MGGKSFLEEDHLGLLSNKREMAVRSRSMNVQCRDGDVL